MWVFPAESVACDGAQLRARRVGEVVGSTFDYIANAVDYPLGHLLCIFFLYKKI